MAIEPLTDKEIKALRELMIADSRRQWLISSIGGTAKWMAALLAGWLAFKGLIAEVLPWPR